MGKDGEGSPPGGGGGELAQVDVHACIHAHTPAETATTMTITAAAVPAAAFHFCFDYVACIVWFSVSRR